MLKHELGFRRIPHSILLLFNLFILVGSVGSVNGTVLRTYYPSDFNILDGTYLSGSIPPSVQGVDLDYFIVGSSPSATSAAAYNPSAYNLFGSTSYVSGTTGDLASDNGVYMTFRSYASATSAQTLYAHQETTTIAGIPYYFLKSESADASGTSLSASMASTGRQLWGKFVYPLTGVSSIPASTWTVYYRAWHSSVPSNVSTNSPSSTLSVVAGWENTTNAYADDATYAITDTNTAAQKYGGYGFNLPNGATINQVRVRLDAWCKEDDDIQLEVSTDGGSTFLPTSSTIDLATSETTFWVDATSWTTWTVDKINNDKIWTKVTHKKVATTDKVSLDWIPFEVTYTTPPSAHADVDILIRKSDNTTRQTIATNAANSGTLTTTAQTLSATYSWSAYTVVDQTDYLEIDYYVDVTTAKSGVITYLRIDDDTLSVADQTRATNVYLPTEYTMEVEFIGSSNIYNWAQLDWKVDSAWTTDSASTTLQLYNYTLGAYPTSGNGFISYTSSPTANNDETKTQTITTNPQHFRDVTGNWKIKVKGLKTTTTQFDFKADWVEFKPTYYSEYTVSTEFLFSSMTTNTPTQLNFTVVSQYNIAGVVVTIQVWNYSSSTYATSGQAYLKYISSGTNEKKLLSINTNPQFYTSKGNAKIKITGVLSTTTQYQQETNQVKLLYSYANLPPIASFSFMPADPVVNESMTFNASASHDPNGTIVSYKWDFGDGNVTTISVPIITHVYASHGTFTVNLTVTDNDAYLNSITNTVTVYIHDVAIVSVSASATEVVSGQPVNFTVVVKNNGNAIETFNVTIFYNETSIETKTVTNLAPGDQKTLEFTWNTTGLTEASYKIQAEASAVSGEAGTNNNVNTGPMVKVSIQTSLQPFDRVTALLYALPVIFGLLFLLVLKLKRKKKTKPHIEKKTDAFSQQFGMTHQQMLGKKMLLEIDPASDYYNALSSFVSEAKSSDELLFILTNKNSALYSTFSGDANIRFLLLTSKTSSPQQINEKETLLPATDLSVLLDAFVRIQKVKTKKTINMLFDNLSDVILKCGFEKTYKFMGFLLEAISSRKTTGLFVFNPTAHDQVVASSIRGLFKNQIAYTKSGPKIGVV